MPSRPSSAAPSARQARAGSLLVTATATHRGERQVMARRTFGTSLAR
ncbi:hypothetical protein [Myxococcus sp. RHSTA-1-4]|nr:hypothetical protein [Myxococcus sp. RHSTA-1-4]MBZ4415229.1 hypothetical protein [Myxococcus sp. RHSTA-1-4]